MIKGSTLRDAIISGANNITKYKQSVDELNVFPVPDGDTGTNMSMTLNAAARELLMLADSCSVSEVSEVAASALLRGARGNSGVILSLLFRGFARGLKDKNEASASDIAESLLIGVESAYKAVMKPTEGTILTVARKSAKRAQIVATDNSDPVFIWEQVCRKASETLDKTPEMLPVLKKAGVVDAGGKGLLVIYEGMLSVFKNNKIVDSVESTESIAPVDLSKNAAGEFDGEITFTYCTEFIVNKTNKLDPLALRAYLEAIGDSVVVVEDDNIIKVHVHTDNPGKALEEGLKFGYLFNMKIENMREQHAANVEASKKAQSADEKFERVQPEKPYGFVAVCAGEGIKQLFCDLGVDNIVSGGQTMNPSTDDILKAIMATPAQTVFVFPNNKNIIMAAEQAIPLADRDVRVLHTKTIPQGLSAMLSFDPEAGVTDNLLAMTKASDHVGTGQITFAARDSDFDGYKIKKGEILALENGKLSFIEKDVAKAAVKLTRGLVKRDTSFITIIYGKDITEEMASEVEEGIRQKVSPDIEIAVVNGEQPVYYYIISVD